MREDVVLEIAFLVEGFITVRTLMPFHQVVSSLVGVERGIAIEGSTADSALERLVRGMNRLLKDWKLKIVFIGLLGKNDQFAKKEFMSAWTECDKNDGLPYASREWMIG